MALDPDQIERLVTAVQILIVALSSLTAVHVVRVILNLSMGD